MGVTERVFTSKQIAQYYDVSEDHYAYFWNLNKSHSLHYGFWDDTTKNFHQALWRINEVMSTQSAIQPGMKVLDAGCGVGGSVAWLAKFKQADVTGITLSEKQMRRANQHFQKLGIEKNARVQCADFTQTPFENNTFDIVWAIESVCHAADKADFIKEAFRILKPGGSLILCDFFTVQTPTAQGQKEMDAWAHGWAVPFFDKQSNFNQSLQSSGFQSIEWKDITPHIVKSAKRLYYSFFPGIVLSKLYNLFHPNVTEASKNNVWTAYYQYTTLKAGWWKYFMLHAKKPF